MKFANLLWFSLSWLFALHCTANTIDHARLVTADSSNSQWISHGKNYAETRHSPLAQINTETIHRLGMIRKTILPSWRGIEATPLLIDGVLYFTGPWSVAYAVSATTGEILWTFDPQVPRQAALNGCCDVVNRGLAAWGDNLYLGTFDGRLVAINRHTGKQQWEVLTVEKDKPYTITGAPRVVNGRVFIGNGGAEFGVRGYFSAYDAANGKLLWRFFTVPGNPADGHENDAMIHAAKTWTGQWWKYGGGGTVWDSMAYDPELDLLYVGTGNGSPWDRKHRSPEGGDNLYLSSILAIKPATGKLAWYYQTTPGETWDFTATQHMILADINMNGQLRKVLMQAPKNGFFYVIDRVTGELLRADAFTYVNWAKGVDIKTGRPLESNFARYENVNADIAPNFDGGHNWHPMAYNPVLGYVFIPGRNTVSRYGRDLAWEYNQVGFGTGAGWNLAIGNQAGKPIVADEKAPRNGFIKAWNPATGKVVWEVKQAEFWNGGLLSTGGNLVFQGTADGRFTAYDARSGKLVYDINTGIGTIAPPISYEIAGKQYIAVTAGWGGGYGMKNLHTENFGSGAVLIFSLTETGAEHKPEVKYQNNQVSFPRYSPATSPIKPDPAWAVNSELYAKGKTVFFSNCAVCHAINEGRGGVAPNLRTSAMLPSSILTQVVLSGVFQQRGMPSFAGRLNQQQVDALSHFLQSQQHQKEPATEKDSEVVRGK